jgi:hypothetical protein
MNNKPSELSKPAAFIVRSPRGDVAYRTISQTDADYIVQKGYACEPLYSQEYVSALQQRMAELEAIATEYAGKFQKAQDAAKHLVIMNDSAQAEIAHLKTLLATPVRLSKTLWYEHDDLPHEIPVLEKKKVVAAIRAAGFTVEGDE